MALAPYLGTMVPWTGMSALYFQWRGGGQLLIDVVRHELHGRQLLVGLLEIDMKLQLLASFYDVARESLGHIDIFTLPLGR